MNPKRILIGITAAAMLIAPTAMASNPIITSDDSGNRIYAGDPAAFVDDDGTVYLYVGQDTGDGGYYNMPNWLCYSSTDLQNWQYRGVAMAAGAFSWNRSNEAWASQVIKHNGKYYLYGCGNSRGIGVAVSDSPTGPFTDARNGSRLIEPGWTAGKVGWDDIDPTVWVENDENGVEHRYISWGNSNLYMAELQEDMINLVDKNNDGVINGGDITELTVNSIPSNSQYTEAPWIYRRAGDSRYYMFFATNWREDLSYAVSDNIWGPYEYGGLIMGVGASSNTNHPAVIDFNGETYLIYHTGALERGGGYLRSVCIDRLVFDTDANPAQLEESSVALDGTAVKLTIGGESIFHNHFDNQNPDSAYPMGGYLKVGGNDIFESDSLWEIVPGLISGENYVSVQSVNKMGYYVTEYDGFVKLLHNDEFTDDQKTMRTFIAEEAAQGTSFESLSNPGKYLSVENGIVVLSDEKTYFEISPVNQPYVKVTQSETALTAEGTSRPDSELIIWFKNGEKVHIGYAKTDKDGNFSYTYVCDDGYYEVYAVGRTVMITKGGN